MRDDASIEGLGFFFLQNFEEHAFWGKSDDAAFDVEDSYVIGVDFLGGGQQCAGFNFGSEDDHKNLLLRCWWPNEIVVLDYIPIDLKKSCSSGVFSMLPKRFMVCGELGRPCCLRMVREYLSVGGRE